MCASRDVSPLINNRRVTGPSNNYTAMLCPTFPTFSGDHGMRQLLTILTARLSDAMDGSGVLLRGNLKLFMGIVAEFSQLRC